MEKVYNLLEEKGLSKTKVRVEILKTFLKSSRPLSIHDLKKNPKIKGCDESSIYRNLKRLEQEMIIHSVSSINGFQSYEIIPKGSHHHHITCKKCKTTQCLPVFDIDDQLKQLVENAGFFLESHCLELSGYCQSCQKSS